MYRCYNLINLFIGLSLITEYNNKTLIVILMRENQIIWLLSHICLELLKSSTSWQIFVCRLYYQSKAVLGTLLDKSCLRDNQQIYILCVTKTYWTTYSSKSQISSHSIAIITKIKTLTCYSLVYTFTIIISYVKLLIRPPNQNSSSSSCYTSNWWLILIIINCKLMRD